MAAAYTARLVSTFFGCGYFPIAPGTAGSAVALAIAIALEQVAALPPCTFAIFAVVVLWPAIWSAGVTAEQIGRKDPSIVVIDEVIGQWISLAGSQRLNWKSYLGAFLLFRLLDIWKPPPVRNLEALSGGVGITADDVMAGVYAAAVMWLAGHLGWY